MKTNTKDEYLNLKIDECDFSSRVENALKRSGITTVGELLKYNEQSLKGLRCMGNLSYVEVKKFLDKFGLKLKTADETALDERISLHKLKLSKAIETALNEIGINNLDNLVEKSAQELLDTKLLGINSVNSVRDALLRFNLHLAKDEIQSCNRCFSKFAVENSNENKHYCRICKAKMERINNMSDFGITLMGPDYSSYTKSYNEFILYANIKNNTETLAKVELLEFYLVINDKQYSPDSFLTGYEFETESIMPFSSKCCGKRWDLLGKEYCKLYEDYYVIIAIKYQSKKYMFKFILKNNIWIIDDYFEEILVE